MLERIGSQYGKLVKTLRFENAPSRKINKPEEEALIHLILLSKSTFPQTLDLSNMSLRRRQGHEIVVQEIYSHLVNVEVLILEDFRYFFYFQRRAQGRLIPNHIITSVKKLFISRWTANGEKSNLTGRNALWLLVFCPLLDECALAVDFSIKDFGYLIEHRDAFNGLSSVSKLA